jgi:hypothetical protein
LASIQEELNSTTLDETSAPEPSNFSEVDDIGQRGVETPSPEVMISDMACLLDSALRKLIGIRRISAGLRIVKSTQAHSLIDIAPAVWDLQYLQVEYCPECLLELTDSNGRLWQCTHKSFRQSLLVWLDSKTLDLTVFAKNWISFPLHAQ